jgi:hypothetical protein
MWFLLLLTSASKPSPLVFTVINQRKPSPLVFAVIKQRKRAFSFSHPLITDGFKAKAGLNHFVYLFKFIYLEAMICYYIVYFLIFKGNWIMFARATKIDRVLNRCICFLEVFYCII